MLIDAKNLIVGRFATIAAKKALLGEKVDVINCEKAVISCSRENVLAKYKRLRAMGAPKKGPFLKRMPDRFVKRIIKGMLPMSRDRGKKALKNVKCHIGVPEQFKDKKADSVAGANADKLMTLKKVSVGEVCKLLGAKWNE
ncbi:MAG: 50S ribosomal protein L13 [Nanoarchaeota archaeon]|nr:50S ribosomal protein L13 [Nanoarchaeota archaeon]MBU1321955.1 50S ribosomal protein L13 [Nanoarchaeota archaeon]MBU1597951.1 50S ribosomal protein L13 [Nanoarchaeota archaeon]MBU2441188.1 50S ribosomal protein L13 [Nanoarchaeota archaeon]